MYIEDIAQVYEEEELNFATDEEEQRIRFKMNTKVSPDVSFTARIVNETTALFTTILPMNIPEAKRDAVALYLNRANWGLLLGNFEMDPNDGELCYRVAGCFEENEPLADEIVRRMTYVGFNMFDKYVPGVFAIVYGNKGPVKAYEEIEAAEREAQAE